MISDEINSLQHQLTMARNELNKLRQQMRNLQYKHKKDVDEIVGLLKSYRCKDCQGSGESDIRETNSLPAENMSLALPLTMSLSTELENGKNSDEPQHPQAQQRLQSQNGRKQLSQISKDNIFRTIGVIHSCFPEKRAVPRQASIGNRLKAAIELHPHLFTNPDHALVGLEDYSHLWIIYYFHKNSSHAKAKVAPPRLNGERIGIFATRSPHRPSPIGLSLVEIDRIEGTTISFFGTDMVDGTPVLDIKPYIPAYDTPLQPETERTTVSDGLDNYTDFYGLRQEPDGEESDIEYRSGATASRTQSVLSPDLVPTPAPLVGVAIRVPAWVQLSPSNRLSVVFSERAKCQLEQFRLSKQCIIDILEADPRSVYLRTKYNTQIFTFQLSESTVTCKFDDRQSLVTVVQIRPTFEHLTSGVQIENGPEELLDSLDRNHVQLRSLTTNE